MNRVFVTVGPLTIYWYSLIILIALLIGCSIAVNYSRRLRMPSNMVMDMLLGVVISAIIGARIYYIIFNFKAYQDNIMDIFMIWKGGLAIYGAIIGGILYILYYSVKKNLSFIRILDVYSLSLLLGQAIGRWGNFFNGEAYGGITTKDALVSLHLPNFIINGMYIDGSYRVPTFLYESLWCFIGVVILYYIRKRKGNIVGKQVSFYLMWYGFGRLVIEGMRSDSLYFNNIRISQIVSVIIIIIGLVGNIIIYLKKKSINRDIVSSDINGRI